MGLLSALRRRPGLLFVTRRARSRNRDGILSHRSGRVCAGRAIVSREHTDPRHATLRRAWRLRRDHRLRAAIPAVRAAVLPDGAGAAGQSHQWASPHHDSCAAGLSVRPLPMRAHIRQQSHSLHWRRRGTAPHHRRVADADSRRDCVLPRRYHHAAAWPRRDCARFNRRDRSPLSRGDYRPLARLGTRAGDSVRVAGGGDSVSHRAQTEFARRHRRHCGCDDHVDS